MVDLETAHSHRKRSFYWTDAYIAHRGEMDFYKDLAMVETMFNDLRGQGSL